MKNYYKGMIVGTLITCIALLGSSVWGQAVIVPQSVPIPTKITAASGTGITVVNGGGLVIPSEYIVTVTSAAFIAANTTSGITIATLPAKTRAVHMYADLTQVFACASSCTTATLSLQGGIANNGSYLGSFDADAAIGQFGFANGALGSSVATTNAAAAPFGLIQSWSSTTALTLAMVSGTGNIGSGAATFLSQGSVTIYILFVPTI